MRLLGCRANVDRFCPGWELVAQYGVSPVGTRIDPLAPSPSAIDDHPTTVLVISLSDLNKHALPSEARFTTLFCYQLFERS